MIGNEVEIRLRVENSKACDVVRGELRHLDANGAYIYMHAGGGMVHNDDGLRFYPMVRIVEISDKGRRGF